MFEGEKVSLMFYHGVTSAIDFIIKQHSYPAILKTESKWKEATLIRWAR